MESVVEIGVALHIIQKVVLYFSDVIFIRNPFYNYVFSIESDITFIQLLGGISAIKFQYGASVWNSFVFLIGVLFKITLTEKCLDANTLLIFKQIFLSLGSDNLILSSSEHLNTVYGINFQNNSSFTKLDFENLAPHLFVLHEHSIIFDYLCQLVDYRLSSDFPYGEEFNLTFYQTAEYNHFRCFIEYIWLLQNDYITQKDVEDILIFFKK